MNIQEIVNWMDKNDMSVDGIRSHLMVKHQEFTETEINMLSQANAVSGAMQEIDALIGYIDTTYDYFNEEIRVPLPQVITAPQGESNGEGQETQETEQGSDTHSGDQARPLPGE